MSVSNPSEPHMACVLLLDTSSSDSDDAIWRLNKAISVFKEQTSKDELALKRVDIATIEFNEGARIVQSFVPLEDLNTQLDCSFQNASAMRRG